MIIIIVIIIIIILILITVVHGLLRRPLGVIPHTPRVVSCKVKVMN